MKQARLIEPERIVLEDVERPIPARDQVLIKVRRIGMCGSDIHAYYDKHPYIRCPIVQGHEFSGEVVEIGEGVQTFSKGDRVTVMPQLCAGNVIPVSTAVIISAMT